MAKQHESRWSLVTEAALHYAEADDPRDFARARDRLRKAAVRYGLACVCRQDREVRVRVYYVSSQTYHPAQLCLWPARTKA